MSIPNKKNGHIVANLQRNFYGINEMSHYEKFALEVVEGVGLVLCGNGGIDIWTESADKAVKSIRVPWLTEARKWGIAALPNGRFVTAAFGENHVDVWDAATGRCIKELRDLHKSPEPDGISRVFFMLGTLPEGLLVTVGNDHVVRIWDVDTGTQEAILEGHTSTVPAIAVFPDGRLASGSNDKTIRLWNVATRTCTHVLPHPGSVYALAVLNDGRLASALWNGLYIWKNMGGEWAKQSIITTRLNDSFLIAALPNGLLACSSGDLGVDVAVWDVDARVPVFKIDASAEVRALTALPDGRLAVGERGDRIRIYALTDPGSPEDTVAAKKAKALKKTFSRNISVPAGPIVVAAPPTMELPVEEEVTTVQNPMAGITPTEELLLPPPVEMEPPVEVTTVQNPMAGIAPTEERLLPPSWYSKPPGRLPPISTPISTVFPNPVALFAPADPPPAQSRFRLPPLGIRLPPLRGGPPASTLGNHLAPLPDLKGGKRRTHRKSKRLTKRKNKRRFKRVSRKMRRVP